MVGPTPPSPAPAALPASVTIDDFRKIALKVGKIIEAADHPNADKLLVLKVDLGGGEVRQVVSGIKKWYLPATLVGKSVVVVTNLQAAMLRGVESQGMVLAATSGDQVVLVAPEKEAASGSKVS